MLRFIDPVEEVAKLAAMPAKPVKQASVKQDAVKHPVKQAEKAAEAGGSKVTVRSSPEAFRAYHRASMAKRRTAAKQG